MAQANRSNIIPFHAGKAAIRPARFFTPDLARPNAGDEARATMALHYLISLTLKPGLPCSEEEKMRINFPDNILRVRKALPLMTATLGRLLEDIEVAIDSMGNTLTVEEVKEELARVKIYLSAHRRYMAELGKRQAARAGQ